MVITQAYTLLSARRPVAGLRVVYPAGNGAIEAGARLLAKVCRLRGVALELTPVAVADLRGQQDVEPFVRGLRAAVAAAPLGGPSLERCGPGAITFTGDKNSPPGVVRSLHR